MIQIHTKLVKKKWFCFGTFDGTDYSYTGKTKDEAQNKMKKRIDKSGLSGHVLWTREEVIQPQPLKPKDSWIPPKIDNNPIA